MSRIQTGDGLTDLLDNLRRSEEDDTFDSPGDLLRAVKISSRSTLTDATDDELFTLQNRMNESSTDLEAFNDQLFRDAPTDVSKLRRYNQVRRKNELPEVALLPPEQTAGAAMEQVGEDIVSGRGLPFVGGVLQAKDLFEVLEASERAEEGTATFDDWELLAEFQEDVARQARGSTIGADIVGGVAGSAAWATEFAASGGILAIAKKAILKGGAKVVKKGVSAVIKKAISGTLRTPFFAPRIRAKQLEDMLPKEFHIGAGDVEPFRMVVTKKGESFGKALVNAGLDTVIELFSEGTGEIVGIIARPLKRVVSKIPVVGKIANFRMPAKDFLAKFGYSTLPGELAEERVGATLRTAFTEISKASGFDVINLPDNIIPTAREFGTEAAVLGVLGGGGAAIGSALQPKPPAPLETPEAVQAFATDNPEAVQSILKAAEGLASGTPNAKTFEDVGIPDTTRGVRRRITEQLRGIQAAPAEARPAVEAPATPAQAAPVVEKTQEQAVMDKLIAERPAPTDKVDEPTIPPPDPISMEAPIPRALPVRLTPPAAVKAISAPTVIEGLERTLAGFDLNVPIRSGQTRKAAGVFKIPEEVIRIRTANDIGTALHEFGHAIEYAAFSKEKAGVFANKARESSLTVELEALGADLYKEKAPPNGYLSEGFAEFVYLWSSDPNEAKRLAPKTFAWFEARFLPSFPIGSKLLHQTREEVQRFIDQGALSRVDQAIVDPESLRNRARRFLTKVRTAVSFETHIDSLKPILDFTREVEQQIGRKLEHGENPYLDASALNSAHIGRFSYMVDTGMIDFNGNPTGGPSLNQVGSLMRGKTQERDLTLYMYARRSIALLTPTEKYPQGRNPGITIEDATKVIDELDEKYGSRIQQAASTYYEWNDGILNYVAQASPEFAETVKRVREDDPGYYLPLYREFDQLDEIAAGIYKSGADASRATISKRLRGSGRRVVDPIGVAVNQSKDLMRAAHERFVLDQILRYSKLPGFGHVMEEVPDASPDTVEIVEDGETKHFVVDQRLKRALNFENPYLRNMNFFAEWLLKRPARFFRVMTTSARMSFSLIQNPIRDAPSGAAHSQANGTAFGFFYQFMKSMISNALDVTGVHRSSFRDAELRLGGQMAQQLFFDRDISKASIRKAFQGRVLQLADPRNWGNLFLELLSIPESAGRQAELRQLSKDVGWAPGQPMTTNQSMRLLLGYKQVTTDFSAAGTFGRFWNTFAPFYNANIQGPRTTLRAIQRRPTRTMLRMIGMITMPTLALWWRNKDEDWYQEIPARERALYWFIRMPWPVDTVVRIPRPFEIGQFFAAIPEGLLNAAYREDPELIKEWFPNVFDVIDPLQPLLVRETVAQLRNFDTYWKSPIVSRSLDRLPAEEQVSPYTTRVSQFLGDMFNISPVRIDHAIRNVGGGFTSDLVRVLGIGPTTIEREGEEADIPVIGRLFRRGGTTPSGRRTFDKMYELLDEAQNRQASRRIRETPQQRQERLLLSDTARAVGNLLYARSYTPEVDRRKELQTEAIDIAQQTLAQMDAGTSRRAAAKGARKQTQHDRLVAKFRSLDLTSRRDMVQRFREEWADAGKKARGKAYLTAIRGLTRAMNDAGIK